MRPPRAAQTRRGAVARAEQTLEDVVAVFRLLALLVVIVLGGLTMLGLGVEALSELLGAPLPTVHDDPSRVEWRGLALDLLYGCIAAAPLFAWYLARMARDDAEESPLPASFDTPVKMVNDERTVRVETWTPSRQPSLVLPAARDLGSGRPSRAERTQGDKPRT